MKRFDEILRQELSNPVALKNCNGATIEPMEAMVKSVLSNAMKGDLAAIDARHEAWLEAQRAAEAAEKAAADRVAAEMKIEAQRAKDEAVAARLSEKFNVKTKKR